MSDIITICYLSKKFAGRVDSLKEINLVVSRALITAFIGKTGAGKTTLLRCLNLLELPSKGAIILNGTDITKVSLSALRKIRQKIRIIFQSFNLLGSKSVAENIALPLTISNFTTSEIKKKQLNLRI